MFPYKFIYTHHLLPYQTQTMAAAHICPHCSYINAADYVYCTNCGYPLQEGVPAKNYFMRLQHKKEQLYKAEQAVSAARITLFIIAACLLLGLLFLLTQSHAKYFVAMLAVTLSALFFFLAIWSQRKPFSAMLTAFIILVTFVAIDLFNKIISTYTTTRGISSMFISLIVLVIIMRGVQNAYSATLIQEELQPNL